MKEDVLDYIRKHPVWYVTLCHYPEKYDDLLDEIHQKNKVQFRKARKNINTNEYVGDVTMNETIYDLIDAIKEDKRYLQFKEQSLKLLNQETKELLVNYQNLLQELDDLKKFEKYIDLTQKRQELNEVRKRMSQNENIQKYYQSYYKINELLDEVTKIVFKDISDSLVHQGINYESDCRKV